MSLDRLFHTQGRSEAAAVLLLSALSILALVLSLSQIEHYFVQRTHKAHEATLRLVAGGFDQAVRRFKPLPELISDNPDIRRLLQEPDNQGLSPFINEKLRLTALSVDASDVYVMDRNGVTIASSNYREAHSFVGRDLSYRPYFETAAQGEASMFHALGTTSGVPGLYFAAPILDGIEVVGVLVVKVTTDQIEQGWAADGREIIVSDGNGIVFLSSSPGLRYRALGPLSDAAKDRIVETRQFPLQIISPLTSPAGTMQPGLVGVQFAERISDEVFLADSIAVDLPGWHATVFSPLSVVQTRALYALVFCCLGVLVLALAALLVVQRRARVAERFNRAQSLRLELEQMVTERTAELQAANEDLTTEIEERFLAEDRLRRTQKELVQAGKLAALGHISAAVSHEINQPLTAVKTYANNAVTFLDRDEIGKVRSNLADISMLADRMATISSHLRNFARRPTEQQGAVPVGQVVKDALTLLAPLVTSNAARIDYDPPDPEIMAIGGALRLQHVIVNLVSNAIDAMAGCDEIRIDLSIMAQDNAVEIAVRDYGDGLSESILEQIFDPFFTTKEVGEGMGLGLSIAFNIVEDFGGKLSAENHSEGGAVFRARLQRAVTEADHAAPMVSV